MPTQINVQHNAIQYALGIALNKAIEDVKKAFNYQATYNDVIGTLEQIKYDYLKDAEDASTD